MTVKNLRDMKNAASMNNFKLSHKFVLLSSLIMFVNVGKFGSDFINNPMYTYITWRPYVIVICIRVRKHIPPSANTEIYVPRTN